MGCSNRATLSFCISGKFGQGIPRDQLTHLCGHPVIILTRNLNVDVECETQIAVSESLLPHFQRRTGMEIQSASARNQGHRSSNSGISSKKHSSTVIEERGRGECRERQLRCGSPRRACRESTPREI